MLEPNTIFVVTHRRSGTHWTLDALRNNSPDISLHFLTLEQISDTHAFAMSLYEFQTELDSTEGHVLIKMHDLPSMTYFENEKDRKFALSLREKSPVVYVHRDGRDVMVSLYHYVLSFRDDYAGMPFSEFLRMKNELDGDTNLSRPAFWAHHVQTWMEQPNLIAISYQSLENDYGNTLHRLAEFLGVTLNSNLQPINIRKPKQKPTVWQRIQYRIGLKREKVSSAVQPRKGKSGDWRNTFSDADLAFFMSEAGETMRELGYVD